MKRIDEKKQTRLDELLDEASDRPLTAAERAEVDAIMEEGHRLTISNAEELLRLKGLLDRRTQGQPLAPAEREEMRRMLDELESGENRGLVDLLRAGQSLSEVPPQEKNDTVSGHARMKKLEGAARLARHRQIVCQRTAAAIEANPARALALGRDNVTRSASSFAEEWRTILAVGSVAKICSLLRDTTDDTEQMRNSQPFAGLLSTRQLREISREVETADLPGG